MKLSDLTPKDFAVLRERWLIAWHQEPGFSALQTAEQWCIVISRYMEELDETSEVDSPTR